MKPPKIVILGMGPCGLGAAWRLQELKHDNFKIFERSDHPGGLASSFLDEAGFTWDIGGHVEFSHYPYYDKVLDELMGNEWLFHERSSWIWMKDRFVPYPFQNNIRYLPKEDVWNCVLGLLQNHAKNSQPENFQQWIFKTFGNGIAELFMMPYNRKVWAYSPDRLDYHWIGERVATPDLTRILENVLLGKDDFSWGPNNKFRFPLRGATGEVWRRLYGRIDPSRKFLEKEAKKIHISEKIIDFIDGSSEPYDFLISSIPADVLIGMSDLADKARADDFVHSGTHIVGIGLTGKTPENFQDKSWMYFPEEAIPFYRVTVFSNYSPNNVPDSLKYWSLMAEVSESPEKPVNPGRVVADVIEGMITARLIKSKNEVVNSWHHFEPYGYPTPSLTRRIALTAIDDLEQHSIYSRGRFGAWKYEVSNQDHSFMQGVEAVNRILRNERESVVRLEK